MKYCLWAIIFLLVNAAMALPAARTQLKQGKGFQDAPCYQPELGQVVIFQLSVEQSDKPQYLHIRYSGEQRPKKGEELFFTIKVNGEALIAHVVNHSYPLHFWDMRYAIPTELTKGKKEVTVILEPCDVKRGRVAEIYDIAVLPRKTTEGDFENWSSYQGLTQDHILQGGKTMIYTEPAGWDVTGFHTARERGLNANRFYGLEITGELSGSDSATLRFQLFTDVPQGELSLTLNGRGEKKFLVPFKEFTTPIAHTGAVSNVRSIHCALSDGAELKLKKVRLLKGLSFTADSSRYSLAENEKAVYPITVTNTEETAQTISIYPVRYGWEYMTSTLSADNVFLQPGESKTVNLTVTIPEQIPLAGREKQLIRLVPGANSAAARELTFETVKRLPHPYLIHTKEKWLEIRENTQKIDWMKTARQGYIQRAQNWNVPTVHPTRGGFSLFSTREEWNLMDTAIAYQLTEKDMYAKKVRQFLLAHSNPKTGWLMTRKASDQASVQEGHYFQHLAQAYDLTAESPVYSLDDRREIENMFHEFAREMSEFAAPGGANWAVSSLTGAFFAALATQDLALAEKLVYAPSMLMDKFRAYTMSDGWWYECSISYNVWCTEEYIQVGLALRPFGYSILTEQFPVNYLQVPDFATAGDPAKEKEDSRKLHHGHSFRIRGGIQKPYITIRDMSEGMLKCLDYRGWMFGINDTTEKFVAGQVMELIYYAFREPRAVPFIKMQPSRSNIIYGVPDLPEVNVEVGNESYFSDNFGTIVLRSQNPKNNEPRERIQAVLKYGTHGGYHGHFDRTALLSLMRYGRSFYNPEMIWFGYHSIFYNFYVQSSISKNMVTVDSKQQAAEDNRRLLFSTGKHLQAGCVESLAEWNYPAWGGLRHSMGGFNRDVKAKSEHENRHIAVPEKDQPQFGHLTGFTEPILQRRLMAVTDDYIVIADYAKGEKEHNYDQLFQIKGLRKTSAAPVKHWEQLDSDPLKSAQVITNLDVYEPAGTFKAEFETIFGPGADNRGGNIAGENGVLKMNVFNAWPNQQRTVFAGFAPERLNVERRFSWSIKCDNREVDAGSLGTWVIGRRDFKVDLKSVKTLTLSTVLQGRERGTLLTLFWGDVAIRTADGKTIPVSSLKPVKNNVLDHKNGADKDFENGPIAISGRIIRDGLSAEPEKTGDTAAQYTFDLTGLNAVELTGCVGGDFPVGDESQRRRVFGIRHTGKDARFLTVIEPFEKDGVIESVSANSADSVTVMLKDGRKHQFKITGLGDDGKAVSITMEEYQNDQLIFTEQAK